MRAFRFVVALIVLSVVAACASAPPIPRPPEELAVGSNASSMPLATSPPDEASPEDEGPIPIGSGDPTRGNRNAYVTLVLFSDFQCPFCGRVEPTLDRVREEYGPETLRIVFKNQPLPFHPHATLAAEVGQGVFETRGNDAFWNFHDMAFRRQATISPDSIRMWATAAGADPDAIESGIKRGQWAEKVKNDMALGNRIGANGTPCAFINGVEVSGAQPFDKFKTVIDAELAKAKALEETGVARRQIYVKSVATNFNAPKPRVDDDDKPDLAVYKVPIGSSPVRGKATALVTVVEFSDFQCPYCKRVEPALEQLRKEFGDKIRIVWKDEPLPFHPRAIPAANLARFARATKGDAGFWDVHDRLFASQPALEAADLESVARAAGLDVKSAMAAVVAKAYQKGIDADLDLGDDVQASGTPHFFINGRRLVGAQPFEKFKTIIEDEIRKAEALVRTGVAANAVYDTLTKDGKTAPEPERKTIALPSSYPFRGPANAPVVIQEFADFQCPFCGRVETTIDELMKAYPGKIKLVWRDKPLPMHADAPLAAEAAREAFVQKGNDGFAKMRALLFQNQAALKRSDLDGYATTIGLDMGKFATALDAHTHKATIDADDKAGTDAGITGTPAFVVGPYYISGAQPLTKFKKLVDRTLNPPPAPPVPKAVTTATGLVIQDTTVGNGAAAKNGDTLVVHYTGTFKDGKVFDSSKKSGTPFSFKLGGGQVIKGWDQGLVGMKPGGRRKLTIPSDLAYGDRGSGSTIPPKSTLLFDVELISISSSP
jgi:protein-disulfide isomerase